MEYSHKQIAEVAELLKSRLASQAEGAGNILNAPELRALYGQIPTLPEDQRASFGSEVNALRTELVKLTSQQTDAAAEVSQIDVTAPWSPNTPTNKRPRLLPTELGSQHPLMNELARVLDIFRAMGFDTVESRQLDDEYHMFTSLNFPEGHPARDDYDTFITNEGLVAPAHVSIMQNRLLKRSKPKLERGEPISAVYTGRTFRNEDVDARHEHTFYQVEIIHVGKDINAGNLIATFKTMLEAYYEQQLEVRMQPFYFPFTEPSFEMALSCPFCQKKGCHICSQSGWIELLGMGMVNPNVLREGGVDPEVYTGFAGGMGLDRLVMMKHGIEDVRNFHSGKLEFLRQFS